MGRALKNERRGGNEQKGGGAKATQINKAGAGGMKASSDLGRSRDSKVWGCAKKV